MKRILLIAAILVVLLGTAGRSGTAGASLAVNELELNPAGAAYEVHADTQDRLWVSDYTAGELWRYDPALAEDAVAVYLVGDHPSDAHPDEQGGVWWVDETLLRRLDTQDETMQTWEISGSIGLYGLALDESGKLWLADSDDANTAALFSFDPGSRALCSYALPEGGAGYYPETTGFEVWLGDVVNRRIVRLESSSGVFTTWQLPADGNPEEIAVDETGFLWYADTLSGSLNRLDPLDGSLTRFDLPAGELPIYLTSLNGAIWYTEQVTRSFGMLRPLNAAGAVLEPLSGVAWDPVSPTCPVLPQADPVPVDVSYPQVNWTAGSYTALVDSGGWQVYQLPPGGSPWGLALADTAWVVDSNRQKLVHTPLAQTAPLAVADSYSTDEDTTLVVPAPGVLGNDTDAESDPLTAVWLSGPSHGSVNLNPNGSFTYTPAVGYVGSDSFTYQAHDGAAVSTAAVNLSVQAVNHAPEAASDSYSTNEDTPLVVADPGVLGNDTDAEGDPLRAFWLSAPAHGTLALNQDGSFTYAPAASYFGPDSFTYRAYDGALYSSPAAVSLTVQAVNDVPVSANDAYSTSEDTPLVVAAPGVLGNDTDADSDPLSAVWVSGPAHGALTLNEDGSFTYTPAANYFGSDSFTYQASDSVVYSSAATVSLTVQAVNDAPEAANDAYSTSQDTPLVVDAPGVLVNDSDVENDPLTVVLISAPAHGTLTLNEDGSFTYDPEAGYVGSDSFTYRVSDDGLYSSDATVTLTVNLPYRYVYLPLVIKP